MRALHIAPAQLQKAFPHRICVKYSEQKDCHHKKRAPIAAEMDEPDSSIDAFWRDKK
jgi:hypothetical protein